MQIQSGRAVPLTLCPFQNTHQKQDYWSSKAKPPRWPKIFVVMRMYWKNLPMEYYDFKLKRFPHIFS
jgi:hypothetical protein